MGLFQKSRSAIVSPMNPGEVNQGATIRVEDEFGQEITPAPATPPRLPSPKPSPKKPKKSKKEKKKKKRKTSLNRTQYFPEVVESRKKKSKRDASSIQINKM